MNSAARDNARLFALSSYSISIIVGRTNMAENKNLTATELPWLIFTLSGNAYSVNSKYVNGLEMKSDRITPLPHAPEVYCGMVERRGEVYPLLNMRKVFGFKPLDDELGEFRKLVEDKIAEEKAWFNNLMSQFENGGSIHITKAQNNIKFFEKLSEYNSAVNAKLETAKRAYGELSKVLNEALAADSQKEKEELMNKARTESFRQVLKALDGIVKAQENSFREIVVVLNDGEQMLGLLVDQVLAVDKISSVVGSERMRVLMQSKYFEGVARNDRVDLEILVINEDELLKLSDVDK